MVTVPALVAQFTKACTISTFLACQKSVCDAWKLPVDMLDLAVFKYLLPDEIRLEFEDTPTDTVFNGVPDLVLVFEFADKRARVRKPESLRQVIRGRVERFERALDQYLARRGDLDNLHKLAAPLLPAEALAMQQTKSEDLEEPPASIDSLCEEIDNVLATTIVPKREAQLAPCPPSVLEYTNQSELWSHQARAIDYLDSDPTHNLVISTATASGKSLIFHSLVKKMLDYGDGTALLIYPTKALAQDQLRSFQAVSHDAFTFDGDTPIEMRKLAKQRARILLINPDILHTTILPNWKDWDRFLGNLRYVVMDELHYYGGIFGAHVACVIRRLRRISATLGADTCQFIGCSATLSDPEELMSTLTGTEDILSLGSESDGSPSGAKKFVFCTPNYLTPEDPTTGRMHPIKIAAPLLVRMVRSNMRVIAFCRFRRECELLMRAVYEIDPSLGSTVKAYRGGYHPEDRRDIESLMFSGELRGIVSTTALEVGIDIGNLDAAIICGFPHSIASFRQQVGRVGRRQKDSLVVYVADGSVFDQHYATSPNKVLYEPIPRPPIVLHDSVIRSHIQAAAHELAMEPEDFKYFPPFDREAAKLIPLDDDDGDKAWAYPQKPSINIRKADDEREDTAVIDIDSNKILEHVEYDRVPFTLYDGAIYVHQGRAYLVIYLESDFRYAKVRRTNVKWVTRQRDYTDVDPVATESSKLAPNGSSLSHGQIKVTTKVFGYFKFDQNNQIIDCVDVQIPENVTIKSGMYLNITSAVLEILKARHHHLPGSIHAAEHALMSAMPLFISMAPGDVRTECKAPEKELKKKTISLRRRPARLIFYESHGGKLGNGILRSAYMHFDALLETACDTLDRCDCELGCGACIGSGQCVEHNAVLSKSGAKVILRSILNRSLEGIPEGPDPNVEEQYYQTIVPVEAHT